MFSITCNCQEHNNYEFYTRTCMLDTYSDVVTSTRKDTNIPNNIFVKIIPHYATIVYIYVINTVPITGYYVLGMSTLSCMTLII